MIKIELDYKKKKSIEETHYDEMCSTKYAVPANLRALLSNNRYRFARNITQYLLTNIKKILIGEKQDLVAIKQFWDTNFYLLSNRRQKSYKRYLAEKVFRYDYFSRPRKKMYCAHKLAVDLGLRTCTYCNRNYTFSWVRGESKARCQFDHFVPKGEYPIFALSLYNLIPSCALCNCYEKKTSDFDFDTHHHPYFDSGDEIFRFKIVGTGNDLKLPPFFWYGENAIKNFKIKIVPQVGVKETDVEFIKLMRNEEVLQIENYYNEHKDYALEIVRKAHFYPKIYNETLQEIMREFNFYTIRLKEFYVGNHLISHEFHKRTLAKLTKDIAEQFCLI